MEMDRHYGKSDVYEKLYCVLTRLINGGNEEAGEAREEFEMAEQYSHDSTEELLDIIEEFGLQDAVYQHVQNFKERGGIVYHNPGREFLQNFKLMRN